MKSSYSILFVEDDANLSFLLGEHLGEQDFNVTICGKGEDGLKKFKEHKFHLCILDIVLPDKDGVSLAKEIRDLDQNVPIVFLSSRNLKSDKLLGYEVGADDYITKPFDADLLTMKVNAILKRCYSNGKSQEKRIELKSVALEMDKRKLIAKDEAIKLSGKECGIMFVLMSNAGSTVSRDDIMKEVWGTADFFISKNLDVYMTKIRKIIKNQTDLNLETIHGVGYILS